MKTHTLSIAANALFLFLGPSVHAQVTVQAGDLFALGSRYQVAIDETPGVTPGNSGINLSWNYPGLDADATRIVEVRTPAESPFGPALPGDRAMVVNTDEMAEHFTVSPTQLLSHGRVLQEDGVELAVQLTPPMALLDLPTQQADYIQGISGSRSTTYLGLDIGLGFVVDSIRIRTRINYQSEVTGWGQLTTPFGTFNAIKQVLVLDVTDSIDVYRADQDLWIEGIETTNSDEISWSWWSPAHDIPVLQLFDDENDGVVDRAEWIEADLNTTGVEEGPTFRQLHVHPNPATDEVFVHLDEQGPATYALFDTGGRCVQQGSLHHDRNGIPLMLVERGIYVLRVQQGGAEGRSRITVH